MKLLGMLKIIRAVTVVDASGTYTNFRKAERLVIFTCQLAWKIIVHSIVLTCRIPTYRMPVHAGHLSVSGITMNLRGKDIRANMLQAEGLTPRPKTRRYMLTRPGGNLCRHMLNNPVTPAL